ncbi:hypothetical protein TSUD_320180 [Trifolium subterraneum]|uniref:Disease resistance N-terminal domain-containing protein n=1 Tax=Trifolium subterraneum TaxID=3900 RepID=A0A2Z6N3P3_TRISU|nr:hypothetical protein TSUD_320180 [Trifolium subterraneum]
MFAHSLTPFCVMVVKLVSSFLHVAFDRPTSAETIVYFRRRKLNEKLLNKSNITLFSINAVVDNAEQKLIRNRNAKAWHNAVKDVVLDTEDHIQVLQCKLEVESHISTISTSKV